MPDLTDSPARPTMLLRDADVAYLSWFIIRAHRDLTGSSGTVLLTEAIEHAVEAHRGQTRQVSGGSPVPYIVHPLRNTARLLTFGVTDLDVLIATLLHDTVEDVPGPLVIALTGGSDVSPLDALRTTYGFEVAGIVEAVTNPGEHSLLPRPERNVAYVAHVTGEVRADVRVALVKTTDVLDNAGGLTALVSVNAPMAKRLAAKYRPLIDVLAEILDGNDVAAYTGDADLLRDELLAVGVELDSILAA